MTPLSRMEPFRQSRLTDPRRTETAEEKECCVREDECVADIADETVDIKPDQWVNPASICFSLIFPSLDVGAIHRCHHTHRNPIQTSKPAHTASRANPDASHGFRTPNLEQGRLRRIRRCGEAALNHAVEWHVKNSDSSASSAQRRRKRS
jgi:hypothetical protein